MDSTPHEDSVVICHSIFAYGTLQRDECRARLWPVPPLRVVSAKIRGFLYDLGPYPAWIAGTDWVGGERWELAPKDMPVTLARLDEEEAFAGQPDDLYRRIVVECWDADGTRHEAYVYAFAQQELLTKHYPRISPDTTGLARWSARRPHQM